MTVAVLNGTTTANLAAAVSDKLSGKGFQQGATGNAANQTMATTIVGYQPGAPGAKNDAYAVAVALGLKADVGQAGRRRQPERRVQRHPDELPRPGHRDRRR